MKELVRGTTATRVAGAHGNPVLTAADIQRLTLFKWRYVLEAQGFDSGECEQLIFLRWLRNRRPHVLR